MKLKPISLMGAVLVAANLSANAQVTNVLLFDDFDSYASQAAFEAVWTPIGTTAPLSGTLATDQASSAPQSIRVDGTTANNQQRNQRSFTESGTIDLFTKIVFSFDFYDSNGGAAPYRQHSNLQDGASPTLTGQLVSMGLNNNQTAANSGGNYYMARILGYTVPTGPDPDGGPAESVGGAGAFFKLNDFGVGLRSTGWHNLAVVISTDDGLSADFDFYVDGQLAERVHNVGTAAQFRSYDVVRLGSGLSNAGNAAWWDNFRVEVIVVPEPSAAALGLIGGVALLWAARRRMA
jgi:hypothetical protein